MKATLLALAAIAAAAAAVIGFHIAAGDPRITYTEGANRG